jgi:hypothetical protein
MILWHGHVFCVIPASVLGMHAIVLCVSCTIYKHSHIFFIFSRLQTFSYIENLTCAPGPEPIHHRPFKLGRARRRAAQTKRGRASRLRTCGLARAAHTPISTHPPTSPRKRPMVASSLVQRCRSARLETVG